MLEEKRKEKVRSSAYPSIDLKSAINIVSKLKDNAGKGPYNREYAARAAGYSSLSGSSGSTIAALVHFGLLDRKGDTYSLSDLACHILIPKTDGDKLDSIVAAAKTPKLYAKLLKDHMGQSIPKQLDNLLFHNYSISENASHIAAKNFIISMEFAGLLENGVLKDPKQIVEESIPEIPSSEEKIMHSDNGIASEQSRQGDGANMKKTALTPQFNFNIQIQIPDNSTPETYDAIFKSMASNLFSHQIED